MHDDLPYRLADRIGDDPVRVNPVCEELSADHLPFRQAEHPQWRRAPSLRFPPSGATAVFPSPSFNGQTFSSPFVSGYRGKRILDILLTTVTAPLWAPTVAVLALVVRVRLGAPAFFGQMRPGLHGAPFYLIKLRTMSDARDATGIPLPDEARLNPLGRFLRSTSLDELPELWNVLRGEMSLVGPRPLLTKYLPLYNERHRRRHDVRPGVTGMAQVGGRNAITWPQKLDLDVEYVDRCSFMLDVRILWRSARAVLQREGISAKGEATMPEFTGYDRA